MTTLITRKDRPSFPPRIDVQLGSQSKKATSSQLGLAQIDCSWQQQAPVGQCPPKPPPSEAPRTEPPCVDEAIILDERKEYSREDRTSARTDPMIVRGTAQPGATVRVYNPDIKGWPLIAEATAGADGRYEARCDDLAFFARGDRAHVTAHQKGQRESVGKLVQTHTVTQIHRVHERYLDNRLTGRTEGTERIAHELGADDRPPYLDDALLARTATADATGRIALRLSGAAKSVPPGSSLEVVAGGAAQRTVALADGRFDLALPALAPGSLVSLRIKDVNERVSEVPLSIPSLSVDAAALAASSRWDSKELVIETPPIATPGSTLLVRRGSSGEIERISADDKGAFTARLCGVEPYEVLQLGMTVDGRRTADRIREVVALPPSVSKQPLMALDGAAGASSAIEIEAALNKARTIDTSEGSMLEIGAIQGLPPHGRVDFYQGKELAFQLRADAEGAIDATQMLGAVPGERFEIVTADAAGRRLGFEVPSWTAPDATGSACKAHVRRRSENASLGELVQKIGSGEILPERRVAAVEINTRLSPDDSKKSPGVAGGVRPEILQVTGQAERFFAEAEKAGPYDSMRLSVADWTTGQRNIVFEQSSSKATSQLKVQVALPFDGRDVRVQGKEPLPNADACVTLLGRAVSFAALCRSVGQGPGDRSYDGAIAAAHTLLYAIDRIALNDPSTSAALKERASAAVAGLTAEPVDARRWAPGGSTSGVSTRSDLDQLYAEPLSSRHDLEVPLFVGRVVGPAS